MQTDMTEDHRTQLQQIQQRDKELDARYLDQIEKGVEDLRDIALRANEVCTIVCMAFIKDTKMLI